MEATTVTSKGRVSIRQSQRRRLGIRPGSKVVFELVGDHLELRVLHTQPEVPVSGFGMLGRDRPAVPADFDSASLASPLHESRAARLRARRSS